MVKNMSILMASVILIVLAQSSKILPRRDLSDQTGVCGEWIEDHACQGTNGHEYMTADTLTQDACLALCIENNAKCCSMNTWFLPNPSHFMCYWTTFETDSLANVPEEWNSSHDNQKYFGYRMCEDQFSQNSQCPSSQSNALNGNSPFYSQSNDYWGNYLTLDECKAICEESQSQAHEYRCASIIYSEGVNGRTCYFYNDDVTNGQSLTTCGVNNAGHTKEYHVYGGAVTTTTTTTGTTTTTTTSPSVNLAAYSKKWGICKDRESDTPHFSGDTDEEIAQACGGYCTEKYGPESRGFAHACPSCGSPNCRCCSGDPEDTNGAGGWDTYFRCPVVSIEKVSVSGTANPCANNDCATEQDLLDLCGSNCATSEFAGLGYWDVCRLEDGQLDGLGHGGAIEVVHPDQGGYNCYIKKTTDCSSETSVGSTPTENSCTVQIAATNPSCPIAMCANQFEQALACAQTGGELVAVSELAEGNDCCLKQCNFQCVNTGCAEPVLSVYLNIGCPRDGNYKLYTGAVQPDQGPHMYRIAGFGNKAMTCCEATGKWKAGSLNDAACYLAPGDILFDTNSCNRCALKAAVSARNNYSLTLAQSLSFGSQRKILMYSLPVVGLIGLTWVVKYMMTNGAYKTIADGEEV